jgi:hypothetical protein
MHYLKKLRNFMILLSMFMFLIMGCASGKRVDGGGTIIGNPELPAIIHENPATDPGSQSKTIVAGGKEFNRKNSMLPSIGFELDLSHPLAVLCIWKSVEDDYEFTYKSMPTGDIQEHGIMTGTSSEAE